MSKFTLTPDLLRFSITLTYILIRHFVVRRLFLAKGIANEGRCTTIYRQFLILLAAMLVFATSTFASQGGNMFSTTTLKVEDSSVSIGRPLSVSFCARAGIFWAFNVTGEILPGEGYEVLSQPQNCVEEMQRGDTILFVGQILPTKHGTWKVELRSNYFDWDGRVMSCPSYFYIELSDTLNLACTSIDSIFIRPNIFGRKSRVVRVIPPWNYDPLKEPQQAERSRLDSLKRK